MATRASLKNCVEQLVHSRLLELFDDFKDVIKDTKDPKRKLAQDAIIVLAKESVESFFELHKQDRW